jgi:site-specific recombinase XerD
MNVKGKSTLEKFKKILKLQNYATNTIKIYSHYVIEFISCYDKPALHITAKDVKFYIENYNYRSISQQNQIYSAVKLFSKHILKIKRLDNIILKRPKKEKTLPKVIDSEFLKSQILKIKNLKHKAILSLGYSCALRVSEVINLKMVDIDRKRMLIHIRNAKGRKDRYVKLSESLLKIFEEYYMAYQPNEYLFNGQNSLQYSPTSCNKLMKKYIGPDTHFHLLRHSGATALHESGLDIMILSKYLGHNTVKTTQIYTHISNRNIQGIISPI